MHWILEVTHPDGTEETFVLDPQGCTLGYAKDCDLHVYEPSVSNHHAKFYRCKDDNWWMEDLGSTNGTWVEDVEIKFPLALSEGMKIVFGDVEALVAVKETVPE